MGHEPAADTRSDQDLLRRVAAGDARAFAALFHRRQREVYRFALHMSGAPQVADDVTQEVFLTVMRDAGRYDPGRATVAAWLCGIARNHVRRRFDAERALVPLDGRPEDGDGPVADAGAGDVLSDLMRAESIDRLRRAIAVLPVRYREVIVLCDLQGMAYGEAASALECAVGTVRSRLHRGRALLASKLGISATAGARDAGPAPRQAGAAGRDVPSRCVS